MLTWHKGLGVVSCEVPDHAVVTLHHRVIWVGCRQEADLNTQQSTRTAHPCIPNVLGPVSALYTACVCATCTSKAAVLSLHTG